MSKEEFLALTPEDQENLVELTEERKNKRQLYFNNEKLSDEEYFEIVSNIYLEQAIEDGIVK